MLQFRQGDLDAADHTLGLAIEQMQGWKPLELAAALLEGAFVRKALGARTEARAMLGEARAIIDSRPDPEVLSHNGSKKWRLSHSTVHSHTKSLYRKIQGSSREEVFGRA